MKFVKYREIDAVKFDNDAAKKITGRVLIGKDDGADNFCMRLFEISKNGHTPCHTHEWEHEIFVHSGNGEVLCNNEWKPVAKGSALFIPGNEKHQIRNNNDEPLIILCLVPSIAPEL
ncbi:MAG: cupin domain-containing protein [Thermodesulfobacteriota bacterium]|nr:cupin domain-containing protein [Thermodesulfobacteriota bacterium]